MTENFQNTFSVPLPLVLPGMTQISVPALVSAVSKAGALGLLATAALTPEEVERSIKEVRRLCKATFGVGIPLLLPDAKEKVAAAVRCKVPVVNFSLGKGDWLIDEVHAYGGKVIATVTTEKHAQAAVRAGADALLVTGHEAAGHGSSVSSLVLVPKLAREFDVPIIAAGGFSDGFGLAAALTLGADAVAMGSRFAMTKESPLHPDSKRAVQERSIDQTLSTDKFDGMDCRIMVSPASHRLIQEKPSILAAFRAAHEQSTRTAISRWTLYRRVLLKGPRHVLRMARMADAGDAMRRALCDGDHQTGIQPIGQGMGLIDDVPDVNSLVARIMREACSRAETISHDLAQHPMQT
ncbi:MAG: nitronate monooxygenase [Gammaproteobacteria bacterium]|jgi:enoyl-[acyl-carrier protein] reductase II